MSGKDRKNKRRGRAARRLAASLAVFILALTVTAPVQAAELPLKKQLSSLGKVRDKAAVRTYNGARLTAKQRKRLNKAIKRIKNKRADVGFVMMNLETGKMIAYNPKKHFFGASTVKGPYTIAVNRSNRKAWKKSSRLMKLVVINSDNGAYKALRARYGNSPMISLHKRSRVSAYMAMSNWPYPNAQQLAKLWCGSYRYLRQDKKTPKKLRRIFSRTKHSPIRYCIKEKTYSKPGWMWDAGRWCFNDAGIVVTEDGPYVIAILTTLYGGDYKTMNRLVRTLHSIEKTM